MSNSCITANSFLENKGILEKKHSNNLSPMSLVQRSIPYKPVNVLISLQSYFFNECNNKTISIILITCYATGHFNFKNSNPTYILVTLVEKLVENTSGNHNQTRELSKRY